MFRLIMLSVLTIAGAATAQSIGTPEFSGTWVIQAGVDAARNRRPINGVSIATEMVIRQSPTELTMETNTGTGGSVVTTTHKLDGSDYDIPGPIGWVGSNYPDARLRPEVTTAEPGSDTERDFELIKFLVCVSCGHELLLRSTRLRRRPQAPVQRLPPRQVPFSIHDRDGLEDAEHVRRARTRQAVLELYRSPNAEWNGLKLPALDRLDERADCDRRARLDARLPLPSPMP